MRFVPGLHTHAHSCPSPPVVGVHLVITAGRGVACAQHRLGHAEASFMSRPHAQGHTHGVTRCGALMCLAVVYLRAQRARPSGSLGSPLLAVASCCRRRGASHRAGVQGAGIVLRGFQQE